MKKGLLKERLAASPPPRSGFCYSAGSVDACAALAPLGGKAAVHEDFGELITAIAAATRPGDHVIIMSNGGFGGIHEKLLARLQS